jgi:hypothetical protein
LLIKYIGYYTFAALHPDDSTSPIDQGSFYIVGMRISTTNIPISGHPPSITSVGQTKLVSMAEQLLDGIYYDVIGMDSILYFVDVQHPNELLPG